MITLISTPEYVDPVSPSIISYWLATESPNNFRLLRHDFNIVTAVNNGGKLRLTVAAGTYTGAVGNVIAVYNKTLDAIFAGTVLAGTTTTTIETDITYASGFAPGDVALDPTRTITYINDNTLHAGYYFEGRLTINGVLNSLTIVASPDSFGYADLDVSGILRITTTIGKITDYSTPVLADTNKSGNFTLEYRECWYGSLEAFVPQGGSPAEIWYYAEAVRSEEQGSNLHEYVANDIACALFLNSFDRPVYFAGLPFDISFIMPERAGLAPGADITVEICQYSSANVLLSTTTTLVPNTDLEGHVCSLTIDPAAIASNAAYFTAEITAP